MLNFCTIVDGQNGSIETVNSHHSEDEATWEREDGATWKR